ncbi:MAG TPA: hypothetical protein VNU95_02820 [Candidatus Acidoferrales bacterium]|jgi:hypothetical protein|nr:hypothetical protein [Candidatus Acidoferrales bacterium]
MGIFSSLFGGGSRKPAAAFVISDEELLTLGWSETELKQIISDFHQLSIKELPANFSAQIQARGGGVLSANFSANIDGMIFCFLVNYVQYPKDFDLESRAILAAGKATIRADFLPSEQSLIGKRMLFYIPADDQQYDIVFAQVDGQSYEFPFSGTRWRLAKEPRLPAGINDLK